MAGFGGLRLGEQNALRAIDVWFDRGYVLVNGSWITPRDQSGFRAQADRDREIEHRLAPGRGPTVPTATAPNPSLSAFASPLERAIVSSIAAPADEISDSPPA